MVCSAVPYGGLSGGLGGGYGSLGGGWGGLSLGGGYGGGLSGGGDWHGAHVNAAIQSHRSIELIPVHSSYGTSEPTVVDIDSSDQPVSLNFNSRSSPLHTTQNPHGQPGSHQDSHSVDEPHVLRHEVHRPVIQEIREVIIPSRNVIQEIKPVIENVQTLVAKGEGRSLGGGLGLSGGLGGGYGGGLSLGGKGTATLGGLGLGGGYGGLKGY